MDNELEGRQDQKVLIDNQTGKPLKHECIHEEDWKEVAIIKDKVENLEEQKEQERKELEKRDKSLKKAFDNNTKELKEIKGIVTNLDKKQALTEQKNGYQDEKIEGIQEEEKQKILAEGQQKGQRKGTIIGAIIGAVVGGLATLSVMVAFRIIEILTFL